jgi:dolichyl-phosphate-mannose--protein O-mannosyl transferase
VLCACVALLVLVPLAIYVLSYIPYARVPGSSGNVFKVMMDNQRSMFDYHSKLTASHPFESVWWKWPLMVKPIWYYAGSGLAGNLSSDIVAFGNPLVWWVGIPCFFAALWIMFRKKDFYMAPCFVALICQYAPWIFVARATFIYHFFSSIPFLIMIIVYIIKNLVESRVLPRPVVFGYLFAVAALFVVYYPVLSGMQVSTEYSDALKLFSSWYW